MGKNCKGGCKNGYCKSGKYICNESYDITKEDNSTCIPICRHCVNGKCIAPNVFTVPTPVYIYQIYL